MNAVYKYAKDYLDSDFERIFKNKAVFLNAEDNFVRSDNLLIEKEKVDMAYKDVFLSFGLNISANTLHPEINEVYFSQL